MNLPFKSEAGRPQFPPTRWSVVLTACQRPSLESAAALEALCRAYWYPLYAYIRRSGQSPQDAQDLAQEFFRLLLEKRWLQEADQSKGRLRTFLITALKRFMAKERRRMSTQRRGGGQILVPIDTAFAESRYVADPGAGMAADEVFDRQWALALLELTTDRLQAEFAQAGKSADFAVLKDSLMAARGELDYRALAGQLGVSEGAVRVAVHRLRRRFREIYREEIAQTLPAGAEVEAEMRQLADALARS